MTREKDIDVIDPHRVLAKAKQKTNSVMNLWCTIDDNNEKLSIQLRHKKNTVLMTCFFDMPI